MLDSSGPKYKTALVEIGGMYYSHEALSVYPVIGGITSLRTDCPILTSNYPELLYHLD